MKLYDQMRENKRNKPKKSIKYSKYGILNDNGIYCI